MKFIDNILKTIESIMKIVVTVLFFGMLVSLSVQVISRYVFNTGFSWTEESARYMMIWLVFSGAVVVSKRDEHISITVVEEMWPKTVPTMKFIQRIIVSVYSIIVMYYGILTLRIASLQTSPNMKIGMNIIYAIYPIAMFLILVYTIRLLICQFQKKEGINK